MRIPRVEALFPAPWPAPARRMLPSPSPQYIATEMWGPVLGWCALQLLAESIDAKQPERTALDLFDRLRLREPFAHAFAALGFEGEEAWRVAARIKVLLLSTAGVGKEPAHYEALQVSGQNSEDARQPLRASEATRISDEKIALAPALWLDPDVRWLCGIHEAEGHLYLIRELYEELLWWLQMPALLQFAGEPAPSRAAVVGLSKTVAAALVSAKAAGYRIDALLGEIAAVDAGEPSATEMEAGQATAPSHEKKS